MRPALSTYVLVEGQIAVYTAVEAERPYRDYRERVIVAAPSEAGTSETPPPSSSTTSSDRHQRRTATVVLAVGAAVLAGWSAWLIHADVDQAIGRRALVFALLFALVPVAPLVAAFVWFGRLRLEPWRFLLVALLWGALVATLASLRLNGWLAEQVGDQYGISARSAVFVAPWVEESTKAAVVFGLMWWRRRDFPLVVAGVVYGGLAGVGFAFTENIVYYGQIFQLIQTTQGDNAAALDAVQDLFRWRGVAAPFVHPMFTMMTGLGLGLALRHRHLGVRILAPVAGFCAAVLLHMGYNTIASFSGEAALVGAYVGVLLPTLVAITVVMFAVRRHERHVLAARLRDYSAFGWLQPDIVDSIVAPKARREARRQAADVSKSQREKVRAFQRVGVSLAVLRDRMVCGAAGPHGLACERELISELRRLRREVVLSGDSELSTGDEAPPSSSW
ncbi:MAG: PrsW family intramembrane metalloprotease [Nocardioidaceae bacterium]